MLCSRASHAAIVLMLNPALGLAFSDLYQREGLLRLDAAFLRTLEAAAVDIYQELLAARAEPDVLPVKQESELLILLAPHVEDFIAGLFRIESEVQQLSARHNELAPLYRCKRLFVQRKAQHKFKIDEAAQFDGAALRKEITRLIGEDFSELSFAQHVMRWLLDETVNAAQLEIALRYAAWALLSPAGRVYHREGVLFKAPH